MSPQGAKSDKSGRFRRISELFHQTNRFLRRNEMLHRTSHFWGIFDHVISLIDIRHVPTQKCSFGYKPTQKKRLKR